MKIAKIILSALTFVSTSYIYADCPSVADIQQSIVGVKDGAAPLSVAQGINLQDVIGSVRFIGAEGTGSTFDEHDGHIFPTKVLFTVFCKYKYKSDSEAKCETAGGSECTFIIKLPHDKYYRISNPKFDKQSPWVVNTTGKTKDRYHVSVIYDCYPDPKNNQVNNCPLTEIEPSAYEKFISTMNARGSGQ